MESTISEIESLFFRQIRNLTLRTVYQPKEVHLCRPDYRPKKTSTPRKASMPFTTMMRLLLWKKHL